MIISETVLDALKKLHSVSWKVTFLWLCLWFMLSVTPDTHTCTCAHPTPPDKQPRQIKYSSNTVYDHIRAYTNSLAAFLFPAAALRFNWLLVRRNNRPISHLLKVVERDLRGGANLSSQQNRENPTERATLLCPTLFTQVDRSAHLSFVASSSMNF